MASILALAALLLQSPQPSKSPTVLWQLGQSGNSYREFAVAADYRAFTNRFPRDVEYTVGESRPETDWSYVHPGPADTWAGGRTHPFVVQFDLERVPDGACRLLLDLANTHYASPPLLQVSVNCMPSYRYQLPTGAGDESLINPAVGMPHTVSLAFPSTHLNAGRNRIALTVIRGSWLTYDCLRLEAGGDIPSTPKITALRAESTILFKKEKGRLLQAVRVWITNGGIEGAAKILIAGGKSRTRTVDLQSGENVVDLLVEPYARATQSTATIEVGGERTIAGYVGKPERKWTIYVGPSAHTDIGYTDLQEKTFQRHNQNTLAALAACARNPQFKWNLEVAFQAYLFSRTHPKEFPLLMQRAREGRIGVQASYLNMLTGLCSGEELMESFWRAQALAKINGFKAESANISDVPTTVGTLPMLLSASGIKYFAEAVNSQRGPLFRGASPSFKQSPFWWEALDGSRVLALFSEQYAQASTLGLATSAEEFGKRLPGWIKQFDRPDYAPDAVYVYGAFSDNLPIDPKYADVAAEWNRTWAYPKVAVTRVDEFFRYVERTSGPKLPVLRGDFGVYWEDGAGSSARETAISRRAKTRLEAAERWLALASAQGRPFPQKAINEAWENILFYDEHTWGAWCATSQPNSEQTRKQWEHKAEYATKAATQADRLYRAAISSLAGAPQAAVVGRYIAVPNEQSWTRNIIARISAPTDPGLRLRDSETGRLVLAQRSGNDLLFEARDVPPMAFRTFLLEKGKPESGSPILHPTADPLVWNTAQFRIRLSPANGSIVEMVDKKAGRNWVAGESWGLNQFIYVVGGKNSRIVEQNLGESKYRVLSSSRAQVSLVENGPLRGVLRVSATGHDLPPVESYIIFQRSGDIDFANIVHKQETLELEAGYFAFPFNMNRRARAFVELPYGVLEAEREQLPGACREWYSANSFVASSDGKDTAILAARDAPLFTIGDIFRGQWRKKLEGPKSTLLSYAFNNYWDTNYRAQQGGDMIFTYSLRLASGPFDPTSATKFGWEVMQGMADPTAPESILKSGTAEAFATDSPDTPTRSALQVSGGPLVGRVTRAGANLSVRLYNPGFAASKTSITANSSLRVLKENLYDAAKALRSRPRGTVILAPRSISSIIVELNAAAGHGRLLSNRPRKGLVGRTKQSTACAGSGTARVAH